MRTCTTVISEENDTQSFVVDNPVAFSGKIPKHNKTHTTNLQEATSVKMIPKHTNKVQVKFDYV